MGVKVSERFDFYEKLWSKVFMNCAGALNELVTWHTCGRGCHMAAIVSLGRAASLPKEDSLL